MSIPTESCVDRFHFLGQTWPRPLWEVFFGGVCGGPWAPHSTHAEPYAKHKLRYYILQQLPSLSRWECMNSYMIVEFVSSGLIFCNNYPPDYTEALRINIRKRILIAAFLYFTTITRALDYKTYAGIDFCVAVIAAHVPLRITRNNIKTCTKQYKCACGIILCDNYPNNYPRLLIKHAWKQINTDG